MILRKWEVRPLDKERAAAFAQTYGVPFFLAMLMNIRGLDDAAHLREFLGEGEPLSDPFLLKDMDKAAARITRAVDNMEKIAVYGDYDADGADCLLHGFFNHFNAHARVARNAGNRDDGGQRLQAEVV